MIKQFDFNKAFQKASKGYKPLKLLKGFYKIEIVREYDHFKEEQRKVVD